VLHGEGDAEVGDERVRALAGLQQDVLRLDVAVHDAARVGVGERVGDLAREAHRLVDGSGPPRARRARSVSPSTYGIT
jgi:hypothetical protein